MRDQPRGERRPRSRVGAFFNDFTLEKSFTVFAFLVAIGLIILCSLDLAIAWPWMQASKLFDATYLLIGIVVLWLTYDVFKDQTRGPIQKLV